MKKLITKFWGVGLVIVLISSLFIAVAPASGAEPLNWEMRIDVPFGGDGFWFVAPGTVIQDFDYDGTGMVMYAVSSTGLYQSTFGGVYVSEISSRLPAALSAESTNYVAIAPDDSNVVVVVDSANTTTGPAVSISVNGGATFSSMQFALSCDTPLTTTLYGVEISPTVTGGARYIAVYGKEATAADPILYYYNYGGGVGAWTNAVDESVGTDTWAGFGYNGTSYYIDQDAIRAFKFSPNFPSDYMAAAVSVDTDNTSGKMLYHVLSFNSLDWDYNVVATTDGYPATVYTATAGTLTVNSASIALLPDYDGGDDSLRIGFVGAAIDDSGEVGGIWRCYDYVIQRIYGTDTSGVAVNSVAFDGTNLAGGAYASNNIVRSADPLATSPTFLSARSLKRIGGDNSGATDQVLLKFVGETLYGTKQGTAGALSKSIDYGNTWNDFSMINSGFAIPLPTGTIYGWGFDTDIYVTENGDPWYMSVYDGTTTSIYRMSMGGSTRVLCVAGTKDLIMRGVASAPDVLFAANKGGKTIYYTADGGTSRWYQRNNIPADIVDLAVESQTVVYIGNGINIYKSPNSGFTWYSGVNCQIGASTVSSLLSVGENQLIVAGTKGAVTFSTDGGTSWTKTLGVGMGGLTGATETIHLAATGIGADQYIFGTDGSTNQVYRSPAVFFGEFKSMNLDDAGTNQVNTGLALRDGILYALSCNGTASYLYRTLAPTISGTHPDTLWTSYYSAADSALGFTLTPSALKTSAGASNNIVLWGADAASGLVWYFDDDVALAGPALTAPADNTRIDIVSSLIGNVQAVNFTWSRISKATAYDLEIALDTDFYSQVNLDGQGMAADNDPACEISSSAGSVSQIIVGGNFQPGNTYYWRVRASTPIDSAWSETRTLIIQPTAATVPNVSSPENGGSIDNTSPAFSWTPVSGATMYRFQLSVDPAFGTTLADTELATAGIAPAVTLDRGTTYFWRVKAIAPVEGDWSTVANFMVAQLPPAAGPPVVVETTPAPQINIPAPEAVPDIVLQPPAEETIAPAYIWAIIIIGAVLVIAVIVLIVRTRRSV